MRFLALVAILLPALAVAAPEPREGWRVIETEMTHERLVARMSEAVASEGMGIVTQVGPTATARARGIEIPENVVMGVFNNAYAVRILDLSTAAMIEAPIRFYLTEDPDGTARLSWKTPSHVFAPYLDEGGAALEEAARELDAIFEAIASRATGA